MPRPIVATESAVNQAAAADPARANPIWSAVGGSGSCTVLAMASIMPTPADGPGDDAHGEGLAVTTVLVLHDGDHGTGQLAVDVADLRAHGNTGVSVDDRVVSGSPTA